MSIESRATEREPEQNEELISRAEELLEQLQEILQRNNGLYPSPAYEIGSKPSEKDRGDREIMSELEVFFERDCKSIPSIEVGQTGSYSENELKKLSDVLWLFKKIRPEYDLDVKEYYIIGKEEAMKLLQSSIDKRNKQIKNLETKNKAAQELFDSVK